jgi:hypothetical protein
LPTIHAEPLQIPKMKLKGKSPEIFVHWLEWLLRAAASADGL